MADRAEAYLRALEDEFPGLRVVPKARSPFSRLVDGALRVVTLGRQSAYMTRYVTTMGRTIYVPADWEGRHPDDRYVTLRHEAVHLRQFRRLGWPVMAVLYLLPILPLGLALGRARLEWEAYAETLRATAEVRGPEAARDPALRAHILRQFTSGAYGWMWPFPQAVNKWIDTVLAELPRS
ncbi:MAG: hypothetical protein ACODAU_09855 [Myxococcota bacterium]